MKVVFHLKYCHNYTPVNSSYPFDYYGNNQRAGFILLDDLSCDGEELTLEDCGHSTNTMDCTHLEDTSVRCQGRHNKCLVLYLINI